MIINGIIKFRTCNFVIIFMLTASVAAHAQTQVRIIDQPEGYRRVVSDVSSIAVLGIWYEKCLGDPQNTKYAGQVKAVGSFLNVVTGFDQVRSGALAEAAMQQAEMRFVQMDCISDAEKIKEEVHNSFQDMSVILANLKK